MSTKHNQDSTRNQESRKAGGKDVLSHFSAGVYWTCVVGLSSRNKGKWERWTCFRGHLVWRVDASRACCSEDRRDHAWCSVPQSRTCFPTVADTQRMSRFSKRVEQTLPCVQLRRRASQRFCEVCSTHCSWSKELKKPGDGERLDV